MAKTKTPSEGWQNRIVGEGMVAASELVAHPQNWRKHPKEQGDPVDRLRAAAVADGVPWLEAGNLRAEVLPAGVDLIVAAHSYDFIGRRTRDASKLGAIGYHPSLLPLHRGRDAVRWAVKLRERVTGGTVYWLNETVDGGPVAAQAHVLIDPNWGASVLWREALQPLGLRLLRQVLADIGRGVLVRIEQDHRLATWEPKLDAPPLYRPELLQIGAAWAGYTVVTAPDQIVIERE